MRDKTNGYIYYEYHKKTEKEEIIETAWSSVFNWLSVIVCILFVFFSIWNLGCRVIIVNGSSMYPTLENDEKIIISSFCYEPKIGDIVVVRSDAEGGDILIKRVVATENQVVDIDYESGTVYVDDVALKEDYIVSQMIQYIDDEIEYPYTVPENSVFLMGDNRNVSKDSRSSEIGSIDKNYIVGKAVCRLSSDYRIY